MHENDKAKISFIIQRGTYCYKVMPSRLKNAGATYQRLVNKIFKEQIGKTMEVYLDDMLVKASQWPLLCEDLFAYLAVSDSVVSSTLIREKLGAQHLVFYKLKVLLGA
ncbi:unnamed protein product [Prunus armeniaca]